MSITDKEMARRVTRYEVAKRVLILFTAIVVTACLVLLLSLGIGNRHRGMENRELLDAIKSCTQPGGECYERSQRRTASAVSDINRVVILAAACAVGKTGTEKQIEVAIQACVIDHLAAQNAQK